MRYRKNPKNRRETYKLYDDRDNLVAKYKPGMDGITEVDIANLHKLDDHEGYINNKERKLPAWYQTVDDEWRERFIVNYETLYGRKPSEKEIPDGHRFCESLDHRQNRSFLIFSVLSRGIHFNCLFFLTARNRERRNLLRQRVRLFVRD